MKELANALDDIDLRNDLDFNIAFTAAQGKADYYYMK